MKKKRSFFGWGLLLYALVLAAGATFVCRSLWIWLEGYQRDYDAAKERASVETYMEGFLEGFDYDYILSCLTTYPQHPYVTEKPQSAVQHADMFWALKEGAGLTYRPNEQHQETAPVFDLFAGDRRIGVVSLKRSKASDDFGFRGWETKAVVFDTNDLEYESYRIHVLAGSTLVVDGQTLTEESRVFSGTLLDMDRISEGQREVTDMAVSRGGVLPVFEEYKVEHCLQKPEITVTDDQGRPVPLVSQSGNDYYYDPIPGAEALAEEVEQRVLDLCQTYIRNIYRKAAFWEVKQYLEYGSQAYKNIQSVQSSIAWGWRPKTVEIRSQEVSQVVPYSGELFSCRYDGLVYKADEKQEEEEAFSYRMLFRKIDGQWYLFYFVLE